MNGPNLKGSSSPSQNGAPQSASFLKRFRAFFIGWLVVPAICVSVIFGVGVHCGATMAARAPQSWVLWAFDAIYDTAESPGTKALENSK
jgi:hypothetical protein